MTLYQFFLILKARYKVVFFTIIAAMAIAILVNLFVPRSYTAVASIIIDPKATDSTGGEILPVQLVARYISTQIDVIKSQKVALKVVHDLGLHKDDGLKEAFSKISDGKIAIEDWIAIQLLKKLNVEPSRESNVINISYESRDPNRAAALVNAFARSYIATNLELRVEPARQVATWFEQQGKALRSELEKAQSKLSSYQREKGIINLDERVDVEGSRLVGLSNQLVQAESNTYDTATRERQAKAVANNVSADTLPEAIASPFIQSLKGDLLRKQSALKQMSANLGENHPEYQRVRDEVDGLKRQLNHELSVITAGISNSNRINQQRENELRTAFGAQKAKLLGLKMERDELSVLVRDVENAQRSYDAALQRYTQANLESQATQANVAVLNSAITPAEPLFARFGRDLLISIALGLLLGIGLALGYEMMDQRVRSIRDLTDVIGLPVLAVLQRAGQHNKLMLPFRSRYLLAGKG